MTPITREQLDDLWRRLLRDGDVPYDFPVKCCYARAHRIADTVTGLGIECKKICVKRRDGRLIEPTDKDGNPVRFPPGGAQVRWTYHVTVVVSVQQPDGSTIDMVLDPSMGDAPMTVDEWIRRMGGPTVIEEARYDANLFHRYCEGQARETVFEPGSERGRASVREKLAADRRERDEALRGWLDLPPLPRNVCCVSPRQLTLAAGDAHARLVATVLLGPGGNASFRVPVDLAAWLPARIRDRRLLMLRFNSKTRIVEGMYTPSRFQPQALSEVEDGVVVHTMEPTPFKLARSHKRFAELLGRLRKAQDGEALLDFITAPGGTDILDLLPHSSGAQAKPKSSGPRPKPRPAKKVLRAAKKPSRTRR